MTYQDIHAAEVSALLETEGLTVIDMRDAMAQSRGQLPGAVPASDDTLQGLMRKRRSDPPVLVYCYHGNSSRDLCGFISGLGLTQVYNLFGGWEAWENHLATATPATQEDSGLEDAHLEWLSKHGFDPQDHNSRVDLGMTSLMLAALKGEHELVDALIADGADPRAVNDDEHHALWFACVNGDVDLVKKLIEHGSDLNNRNVNGVTCVIYAASTGKLEVLKTLVDAGADLGICTHDEVSVMESASTLPVLRFLRPLMLQAG